MKITSDQIDAAYDLFCAKPLDSSHDKLYAEVLDTRAFGMLINQVYGAIEFMAVPELTREKMAVELAHFMAGGILLGLELSQKESNATPR